MLPRRKSTPARAPIATRWLGVIAAAFVLAGQFATAAHIHVGGRRSDAASHAQISTNSGVCAVCE
ncbi:MAG: hypothetical protein ACREQB_10770, partial [Candidatus Binataceae bacterium]